MFPVLLFVIPRITWNRGGVPVAATAVEVKEDSVRLYSPGGCPARGGWIRVSFPLTDGTARLDGRVVHVTDARGGTVFGVLIHRVDDGRAGEAWREHVARMATGRPGSSMSRPDGSPTDPHSSDAGPTRSR